MPETWGPIVNPSSSGGGGSYLPLPSGTPAIGQYPVVTDASPLALGWSGTINSQSGTTYTFVAADNAALVESTNSAATTFTIPPNSSVAFPIGAQIVCLQASTGALTVAPGAGVTLNGTASATGEWGFVVLTQVATNVWVAAPSVGGVGAGIPFTTVTAASATPTAMVAGTLYVANTGSTVFNLPATISEGQVFGVQRGTLAAAVITINANTGQTINNGTSGGSISMAASGSVAQAGSIWLIATSSTTYRIIALANTDAGIQSQFSVAPVFTAGLNVSAGVSYFYGAVLAYAEMSLGERLLLHRSAKTSAYSPTYTDLWLAATSGSFAFTPPALDAGHLLIITNEGTGTITITPSGGSTIDGVATRTLTGTAAPCGIQIISDGTNWHTIGSWGAVT